MQSTVFNHIKVQNAVNFREAIDTNNVYIWVGRPNTDWDDDNNPPAYAANMTNELSTRQDIEHLIKISKTDTCLGIPRIDWELGETYTAYSSSDANLFSENFYVITSDNNVYKCISNNSSGESNNVPIGTSVNTLILADSYQWKFMYNLSVTIASSFLITEYIPVPYDSTQKTTYQTQVENAATFSTGSPPQGHGKNAAHELGADNIIISKLLKYSSLPSGSLIHRQFGLIINPTLTDGTLATDSIYTVDSNNQIDLNSGRLLTLTNHPKIDSTDNESEIIQFVLNF